jgi:hypothetical protein
MARQVHEKRGFAKFGSLAVLVRWTWSKPDLSGTKDYLRFAFHLDIIRLV